VELGAYLERFDAAGDDTPNHEVIFRSNSYGIVVFVFGDEPDDVFFDFNALYGEFAVDLADCYFVVLGFEAFVDDE